MSSDRLGTGYFPHWCSRSNPHWLAIMDITVEEAVTNLQEATELFLEDFGHELGVDSDSGGDRAVNASCQDGARYARSPATGPRYARRVRAEHSAGS